jgi:hypothetical protein
MNPKEEKNKGMKYNASNLPLIPKATMASGVYFYRIHAGEYTGAKKLSLLR